MLPSEIDPYEFKFFRKDIPPLTETYKLFRSSRLLRAKEIVKAISKTNQGLVVLVRKGGESTMYTPESKITYSAKSRRRIGPKNAVIRFLRAKMIDFVVLRFRGFYCCLSRWDKDICSFCITACIGGRASEEMLLSPVGILGDVKCDSPTMGKGLFKFKDLEGFGKEAHGGDGTAGSGTPADAEEVPVNPIDAVQEEGPVCEKQGEACMTEHGKSVDEHCLIDVDAQAKDRPAASEGDRKPYKEVREDEEGLFDYIFSKIMRLVCEDTEPEEAESTEKSKPWKEIEEYCMDDGSDGTRHGYDAETDGTGVDEGASESRAGRSGCESIIRFGVAEDGRLRCVQKNVGLLSMTDFDRLEAFIAGTVDCLRNTDVNYVEVRSEIDFFVVKKSNAIHLYVRDLIHRRERRFMERFNRMFEKLGAQG